MIQIDNFNRNTEWAKAYPDKRVFANVEEVPVIDVDISSMENYLLYLEKHHSSFVNDNKETAKRLIVRYYLSNKKSDGTCIFDRDTRLELAASGELSNQSIDNALYELTQSGFFIREGNKNIKSSTYSLNGFYLDKSTVSININFLG